MEDLQNKGKIVYPKGSNANVRKLPSINADTLLSVKSGSKIGVSTGNYQEDGSYKWYQIKLVTAVKDKDYGWCRNDVIKFQAAQGTSNTSPAAQSSQNNNSSSDNGLTAIGDKILQDLIKSDTILYNRAVKVYALILDAKKRGIDVSDIEKRFFAVYKEFSSRQNYIKTSDNVKVVEKGLFSKSTDKFFLDVVGTPFTSAIAVVKMISGFWAPVLIVVGAIIVGAVTVIVINQLKAHYAASKINYKEIEELENILKTVDPKTADIIREKITDQAKDAYKTGYKDSGGFDFLGSFKTLGLVLGGFIAAKYLLGNNKKNG